MDNILKFYGFQKRCEIEKALTQIFQKSGKFEGH